MTSEVIVAIIGFVGTLFGSLLGVLVNTKLTNYRLEQVEKKVEIHNKIIDRTYAIEKDMEVVRKDIMHIYHEIDELSK